MVEPKLGDLIEISRTGYQHWAIYVGSGYVIHLGPLDECCPSVASPIMSGKAVVKKELLWNILGGDQYRVNNKYDRKYRPLPANKIVQEAESLLGAKLRYSLASNNCEHFVTRLRYGKPRSDQVGGVLLASKVGLVGMGVVALLAIVVTSFLLPRKHEEI